MRLDDMKRALEAAGHTVTPPKNERQELIDLSGLSVRQVGTETHIAYSQISQWTRGNLSLSPDKEARIRHVLLAACARRQRRLDALVGGNREAVGV